MTFQPWEVAACERCGDEGLAARSQPTEGPFVCEACEMYERGRSDAERAAESEETIPCPRGEDCGFGKQFDALRAAALREERRRVLGLALSLTPEGDAILQATANEAVREALGPEPGRKDDGYGTLNEKRRWELLPWGATGRVVDVLTFGARKYAPENWRVVPEGRRRYYAAAIRHLTLWWLGERYDAESGLPHLACAACDVLFLLDLEEDGTLR